MVAARRADRRPASGCWPGAWARRRMGCSGCSTASARSSGSPPPPSCRAGGCCWCRCWAGWRWRAQPRAIARWRPKPPVDPDRGQCAAWRPAVADRCAWWSGAQTVLSNGVGASVGLEAGYAQAGGGIASRLGIAFALRRGDLRILVGAGTAGAIGAAFDAPLTGAFYAFELVIGTYSIGALFPVVACRRHRRAGGARAWQAGTYAVEIGGAERGRQRALSAGAGCVGALCGLAAILLMRGVALTEALLARAIPSAALRLMLGGLGGRRAGRRSRRRALGRPRRAAPGLHDRDPGAGRCWLLLAGEVARLHRLARQRLPRRAVLRLAADRRAGRQALRRRCWRWRCRRGRTRC